MDNKKRIIVNATYASKKPTGLGVFTEEIIKNLIRIEPDLFYVFYVDDFLEKYINKKKVSKFFSPDYGSKGHFMRMLWEQTFLPVTYRLRRGILLFSTVPEAPIVVKNKVVVVHDIIPVKFPELHPKMKYYYFCIVPKILKTSRHLVFDSKSSQKDVFDYFGITNIEYSIIHAGYNRDVFYPVEKGFVRKKYGYGNYFFYVGDMRPYKNVANAIRAFAKAGLEDILFIIAGKKDKRFFPDIKRLIKGLDIEERVIFPDYISLEELPHFYRDSLALFFPSKYEGFGLPPLEAMATGTPVITTKMASLPEVCGDAAIYVDPDNIGEMADALRGIVNNVDLRNSLSNASLKRASQFSWEKAAGEYLNLFRELIK